MGSAHRVGGQPIALKSGFTLVELLVVITIIAILVGLLLPAVQTAREAARRAQCSNNIKQLGLAVLQYESVRGALPPSAHWKLANAADFQTMNQQRLSPNWVILTLPFLEQQNLYNAFDLSVYITDAANASARGTKLPVMLCPTDTYNRVPFDGTSSPNTNKLGDGWARGNYAANASLGAMNSSASCANIQGFPNCAGTPDAASWNEPHIQGVMGANWSLKMAHIRDGTSNTILLGEIRSGISRIDQRGVWAMSGGASALWAQGSYLGDVNGPNSTLYGGDNTMSCNTLLTSVGCTAWNNCPTLFALRMTCYPLTTHNQTIANSMHRGGIFVVFCDGSVHFISDNIESVAGSISTNPSVWDRINTAASGAPPGVY